MYPHCSSVMPFFIGSLVYLYGRRTIRRTVTIADTHTQRTIHLGGGIAEWGIPKPLRIAIFDFPIRLENYFDSNSGISHRKVSAHSEPVYVISNALPLNRNNSHEV